jgi:sulfite reductase beta subunit-like hemoprotein
MVRARITGGIVSPEQWLQLDELARDQFANGSIRVTTRQTFQFHGVIKRNLKATIRRINDMMLSTIAACGDVNRNVMCTPLTELSRVHADAVKVADDISRELTPQTGAYHELWLDGERVTPAADEEPVYGPTYLPRKFKIAIAIPPWNDVDVFAHDVGFIAIERDGGLAGFTVTAGGGMGVTHGDRRHLSPARQRARHLRRRPGGGRGGTDHVRTARLRRPPRAQARAAEVHHRRPRRRLVQDRTGTPASGFALGPRRTLHVCTTATVSAGSRMPTATGT